MTETITLTRTEARSLRASDDHQSWDVEAEPGSTLDELAQAQARQQADDSDMWDLDRRGPHTITVAELDDDGEEIDSASATVTIGPAVPKCVAGDHAWAAPHDLLGGLRDNPGVAGKAGGVTIDEICSLCGLQRRIDTWDQGWTGTGQPVETVRHTDPDDLTRAWAASEAVRRGDWDTLDDEWDLVTETLRLSQVDRDLTEAEVWDEGDGWDRPDARTARAVLGGADRDWLADRCWQAWRIDQ